MSDSGGAGAHHNMMTELREKHEARRRGKAANAKRSVPRVWQAESDAERSEGRGMERRSPR